MRVPDAWSGLPFFSESLPAIEERLRGEAWLPGPDLVFAALEAAPPGKVRVIILGQDPYPTPGDADGLAFSASRANRLPASLRNVFSELRNDLGVTPSGGDLSGWARQGVLLLNSSLSVAPGRPGSHSDLGWSRLVSQAVKAAHDRPLAFVLWGRHARDLARPMIRPDDLRVESAHPSPLSARSGFFGSRPFSRVNAWLEGRGEKPIDWAA